MESIRTLRTLRSRRSRKASSAFTLIELLLVLVILGILAAVVVPKLAKRQEQARLQAAKTDVATLESAIDRFEVDCGRFPSADEGLGVLVVQTSDAGWSGPYVNKVPIDPWQHEYNYVIPGTLGTARYDLWSNGPDGQAGTEDDIGNFNR